jgi:translation initiation factor IF-2
MSDTDNNDNTSGRRTLQLKRPVDGPRPSFTTGGRSKTTVIVEHKRKRGPVKPSAAPVARAEPPVQTFDPSILKPRRPERPAEPVEETPVSSSGITNEEREARLRALESAKLAEDELRRQEEENARLFAEEQSRRESEERAAREARRRREEEAKRKAEEEERRQQEEARRKSEEETRKRDEEARKAGVSAKEKLDSRRVAGAVEEDLEEEEQFRRRSGGRPSAPKVALPRKGEEKRRTPKLNVHKVLGDGDEEEPRQRSLASLRRAREKEKRLMRGDSGAPQKVFREVVIPETITVQELANRMTERSVDVIRALMKMGMMATINDVIDADTAELIVTEFGHTFKRVAESDVEIGLEGEEDRPEDMLPRPPIVTVMGHVDHGKTSLLDALRTTDVVSGEAGGITQHIGAYQVQLDSGQKITFLDTPGHEAFTAMRSRGAKITDIVVLVVAADDGVMPQTVEAINHARAAEVPIIVAINKIDKPGATPDRVRQELLQHGIVVESLGGDVQDVEVSALKKMNLDKLQEAILLQAEILELKANPNRAAEGVVVEAQLDKGRGPVATVLVKRGTLKMGDVLVAGAEYGRVRALMDDRGRRVERAEPGQPVVVLGLNGTPGAGDNFSVVESEARARDIADFRTRQLVQARQAAGRTSTLEGMFERLKAGETKVFPILLKGDVQGSVEAIATALDKLGTDEVEARVIHSAVGGISETDVSLAKASQAVIMAFNVRANKQARDAAERDGVEIRYYSVIYDLIDDVKKAMSGLLAPEYKETIIGTANVLQVFSAGKAGKAAGCIVTDGAARAGAKVRLVRNDVVVYQGELSSLRRFKDEVQEVRAGTECGMAFKNFEDIKPGDVVEIYTVEEIVRSL